MSKSQIESTLNCAELRTAFADILAQLEDRGMTFPLVLMCTSSNGSLLAIRVLGDGSEGEVLAEHCDNDIFTTPVHCFAVDQENRTAYVPIEVDDVVCH